MEDGTLGKLAREENPRVTFTNAIWNALRNITHTSPSGRPKTTPSSPPLGLQAAVTLLSYQRFITFLSIYAQLCCWAENMGYIHEGDFLLPQCLCGTVETLWSIRCFPHLKDQQTQMKRRSKTFIYVSVSL
jgi:hypothetical protein